MNIKELFTQEIIMNVRNSALKSMIHNLEQPAGRKPAPKTVKMSEWYHTLSQKDKSSLQEIMQDSIDESLFGFFCVLDGVRDIDVKGELILCLNNNGEIMKLNDENDEEYLHDVFNRMTAN